MIATTSPTSGFQNYNAMIRRLDIIEAMPGSIRLLSVLGAARQLTEMGELRQVAALAESMERSLRRRAETSAHALFLGGAL